MADPRNSKKIHGKRWYVWTPPGEQKTERYWSVTTIIDGGMPKFALIPWAAKMTALYAIENVDLIKQMVDKDRDANGKLPPYDKSGKPTGDGSSDAYELLTKARFKKSGKAADLGTEVHEAIEAWTLGKPLPDWRPEVEPYMLQFLEFLDKYDPVFEASEISVYNRTYRYAGTTDAICSIGGHRVILDTKTGGVWPEVGLQEAAYRFAEFIGAPDGSEIPMPKTEGAVVLDLKEDGFRLLEVRADREMFDHFLWCRETFRFLEEVKKTVIGNEVPLPTADESQPEPEGVSA